MIESRDVIRDRMLALLNDKYDKLPGSWTWETYQGASVEFEGLQTLLDSGLDQAFAGTADLEHLKVMAFEDRGIIYKDGTFASGEVTVTGAIGATLSVGDLVANQLQQYAVTETVTIGQTGTEKVKVQCTVSGAVGNTPIGTITNFPTTLHGVNSVTNEQPFTNGYEEEGRDELLKRYYLAIREPGTSGNIDHYKQWALSVDGVGAVKVKPLWNGNGTVKVVILNLNKEPANQQLITDTTAYIETQKPIGASLTVSTAEEFAINISANIDLKAGFTLQQAEADIQNKLNAHFKEIAFVDQTIYYAKAGNIIFNAEGVSNLDYTTFTLNNAKSDIILLDNNTTTQIAKLGTTNITD